MNRRSPSPPLRAAGVAALLALSTAGVAQADTKCGPEMLNGRYVFTATGSTRPSSSGPGTPWVPKAILEVIAFNGDGTLTVPSAVVANPFGDTGGILQPPPSAATSAYIVNEDCTGRLHFFDGNGVMFALYVEGPTGDTVQLIQVSPPNNVFQGTARRVK
ncbi:MAG: hypothetical protein U1F10_08430 [Burkholderiales bacterium]